MKYEVIITDIGLQKLTDAEINNSKVNLTHMAVGDKAGQDISVNSQMTSLLNEVYRFAINQISIDDKDPTIINVEGIIPVDVGGFYIREIGVFDEYGDLILIANYPESYKPDPTTEGAGFELPILLKRKLSNTSTIQITVDNSITMASKEYVDTAIGKKEINLKQYIHFTGV